MGADKAGSWSYCDEVCAEDELLYVARSRAQEYGLPCLSPAAGALVMALTRAIGATAVVEVGTGSGVGGLYLLRGMGESGSLTTIDSNMESQQLAREVYAADGIRTARTRLISGQVVSVMQRLAEQSYDVVVLNTYAQDLAPAAEEALRLLRTGGLLIINNALGEDSVANPARRDEETVAIREVGKDLLADERVIASLLPVGDGLLVATRCQRN